MLIYIRRLRQQLTPPQGSNPLLLLLSWLLLGLLVVFSLGLLLLFITIGWILLLPWLWLRRRQIKQFWQLQKAAQQATSQGAHAQHAGVNKGGRVFDGEFREKQDDR